MRGTFILSIFYHMKMEPPNGRTSGQEMISRKLCLLEQILKQTGNSIRRMSRETTTRARSAFHRARRHRRHDQDFR
jgi:hypothetical protein